MTDAINMTDQSTVTSTIDKVCRVMDSFTSFLNV